MLKVNAVKFSYTITHNIIIAENKVWWSFIKIIEMATDHFIRRQWLLLNAKSDKKDNRGELKSMYAKFVLVFQETLMRENKQFMHFILVYNLVQQRVVLDRKATN